MFVWRNACWGVLAAIGLAGVASAQPLPPPPPVLPAAPVAPGALPPGVVTGTTGAAPANLWSFLCLSPDQKARCRDCFCNTAIGKVINSMVAPAAAMSGGLIQNRCALNAIQKGLEKPADSAEGAAARIKKDEMEAKARREAVRYLGTVDCNYWPEAQDALIAALRGDRNECVRFEAALALRSGCCCTPKVIAALTNTVSGSDGDGHPAENSERVKAAAAEALSRCCSVAPAPVEELLPSVPFIAPPPEKIKEKEKEKEPEKKIDKKVSLPPGEYYRRVGEMSKSEVIEKARESLLHMDNVSATDRAVQAQSNAQRPRSMADIFTNAVKGPETAPAKLPEPAMQARPLPSAPPTPVSPPEQPAAEPRKPFFSGLSQRLKGKTESTPTASAAPTPVPVPVAAPAPTPIVDPGFGNPVLPVSRPTSVGEPASSDAPLLPPPFVPNP